MCVRVRMHVCVSDFRYKSICCGYSFELHQQADAIQMGTHNIRLYTTDIEYTDCNLNTSELLDCMWGNTVISYFRYYNSLPYLLYA